MAKAPACCPFRVTLSSSVAGSDLKKTGTSFTYSLGKQAHTHFSVCMESSWLACLTHVIFVFSSQPQDPAGRTGVSVSILRSHRGSLTHRSRRGRMGLLGAECGAAGLHALGPAGRHGALSSSQISPSQQAHLSVRQTQGPWAVPSQVVGLASTFNLTDL